MKKTWLVFNDKRFNLGGAAEGVTDEEGFTEGDNRKREHTSLYYAEKRAEELAKKYPGQRYIVCEIVSAFVVDGLTKETATT